jgi:threonine/homoserine/homoserine lactone efflux protein
MLFESLILLFLGIASSMLGAIPFGLVNLTVLNVSLEQGNRAALRIAYGASFIEVLFGLTALLAGSMVYQVLEGNSIIGYFAVAVLTASGVFFLLRKNTSKDVGKTAYSGFFKGVLLNLLSIQVFLFWILAIAFLSSRQLLKYDPASILLFIAGIWLGKMLVLMIYMMLSRKMLSRSHVISNNINRIIGFVLFGMAFVQFIKM